MSTIIKRPRMKNYSNDEQNQEENRPTKSGKLSSKDSCSRHPTRRSVSMEAVQLEAHCIPPNNKESMSNGRHWQRNEDIIVGRIQGKPGRNQMSRGGEMLAPSWFDSEVEFFPRAKPPAAAVMPAVARVPRMACWFS